jgi:alcohol dehydrogenase class IV
VIPRFELTTASRIVFGAATLPEAGPAARAIGQRALVVVGSVTASKERLLGILEEHGVSSIVVPVAAEPTTETVSAAKSLALEAAVDLVVGLGGGSALDTAKAVAALTPNPGDVVDYLEVIGRGQALGAAPLPVIAIPTTAGTGSEVTRNAVLGSLEHRVKVSLRSPLMLPRLALVDPDLTLGLPRGITATTGLDALTQLVEPFVCRTPNPLTDGFCREGMSRVVRSLRKACESADDRDAREDMSLAALLGGLALANARLGAVHGIAGPFGGLYSAPHGATCAALLPHVMEANLRALRARQPGHPALERYADVARLLTGRATATADDGVAWVFELCADLGVPGLRAYGLEPEGFTDLAVRSARASSMQGNPVELTQHEIVEVLRRAA